MRTQITTVLACVELHCRANSDVQIKYDGEEVHLRASRLPRRKMPQDAADQGSVLLVEKEPDRARPVTCWLTQEQSAELRRRIEILQAHQNLGIKRIEPNEEKHS